MLNARQNELLLKAVDLLNEADVLVQQALGASDECYELHNAIDSAAEDVLCYMQDNNPKDEDA
jgi:hypothetical protein